MQDKEEYIRSLLDKLSTLEIEGASFGGPYVGVMHNDVTRALVAEGEKIIPYLIERLKTSNLNETIFIVFMLRELRAKGAKQAIEELQSSKRFEGQSKDMTLDMQINYFLRDVDTW